MYCNEKGAVMLKRIKLLRQESGLSQRALANQLGISQQSINKYENHNIEPDIAMLRQIADVFRVSVDYLIERTDERLLPVLAEEPIQLDSKEFHIIRNYRQLSPDEQWSIELIIQNYLAARAREQ